MLFLLDFFVVQQKMFLKNNLVLGKNNNNLKKYIIYDTISIVNTIGVELMYIFLFW